MGFLEYRPIMDLMTGTRGSGNPRGGPDSACGGAVDEGEATFSDDP